MTSHPHDPLAWQRPDDAAGRPTSASLVDPEDDLPSANYAGDYETTAIPRYDSDKSNGQPAFGLINDPEPLPYVKPDAGHAGIYGVEPVGVQPWEDDRTRAADRRGTQDLGLLLLRVAVGVLLIAHGLQKAFGWWGGPGFGGWEESLTQMGFQHAGILTYVATVGQIAAGVLLVLGLFTPLAAAGALAYLVNGVLADAMAAHEEARLSDFPHRRLRIQGHSGVRGGGDHLDRSGPVRAGCRTRLGAAAVHRLVCGPSARHRRRQSRCGRCSTAATRWLEVYHALGVGIGHSALAGLGQQRKRCECDRRQPQPPAVLEVCKRP